MTGENMGICLEDWKVCLEEGRGEKPVTMRITGRDKREKWIRSLPVRQVCLTFYGWQVLTEDPGERYLLRPDNERIRGARGLWGKQREGWSALAERLPEELGIFARLWEDPPGLYLDDPEEDRERLADWSRRYKIHKDFQSLYLYTICVDKIRRERGWSNRQWQYQKERMRDGGLFLCLNGDRAYCCEMLYTNSRDIYMEWKYISQEITADGPDQIHLRASCEYLGFPRKSYMVISYRVPEEDHIELTGTSCRLELLDKVCNYWKPGEKRLPDWFLDRELCLCNTGGSTLYLSGIAGEQVLKPGDGIRLQMDEG